MSWRKQPCYYVSVIDGSRYNVLVGPFKTHAEALARVDDARRVGVERDPKAHFYGFGTCRMQTGERLGILNEALGIKVED